MQPPWRPEWQFFQRLKINLPQDSTISLLGTYSEDLTSCYEGICSFMFIAGLFIITQSWKQPNIPSNDAWIMKTCCIYIIESCSAVIKNEIVIFESKWVKVNGCIMRRTVPDM